MADFDNVVERKFIPDRDACATCPHIDIFHVYDRKTGKRTYCIHTDCLGLDPLGDVEPCKQYVNAYDLANALDRAADALDNAADFLHEQQLDQHGVPRATEG